MRPDRRRPTAAQAGRVRLKAPGARADGAVTMRRRRNQIASRVVLGMACVLGLATVMAEPWYGPPPVAEAVGPATLTLPFEGMASDLSRWMVEREGSSAWQAFTGADGLLAVLLLVAGAAVLGCLVPAFERPARAALQLSSLATVLVVLVKLVDRPGAAGTTEPRYGLFLALALGMGLLACASGIVSRPLQRPRRAPLEPL